jgi:fructokinase
MERGDLEFLALGEALVDLISVEQVGSLSKATAYSLYPGGQAANLAATIARLGHRSSLASCVGNDGLGRYFQEEMGRAGVDLEFLQVTDDAPTTAIIVTRQAGTPDFLVYRGADALFLPTRQLDEAVSRAKIVHTSAHAIASNPARETILELIRIAHQQGVMITFDPNYHPKLWSDTPHYRETVIEMFSLASVTKPSLDDCSRLFGSGLEPEHYAEKVLASGAGTVLLTLGADGVLVKNGPEKGCWIPANPVEVTDVTGAGDAFWAGFLSAHLAGDDRITAACYGQALAQAKLGFVGRLTVIPSREQLMSAVNGLKTAAKTYY